MKFSTFPSASVLPAFVPVVARDLFLVRLLDVNSNKQTLRVSLREDSTLVYVFYASWQTVGQERSISNLQLRASLPVHIRGFKSAEAICSAVCTVLSGASVTADVDYVDFLNQIF